MVGGAGAFLAANASLRAVQQGLLGGAVLTLGLVLIFGPWLLRLSADLLDERRERIRSQERAEVAAHLHDSVLQTLALIQRQAERPREVRRLARGQERELRTWLYGSTGYGRPGVPAGSSGTPAAGTVAEAVAAAAAEVEDTYAVAVCPVVVGDCPLDDSLAALAQAAREAMVNAAKHAEVGEVSLYAEVEPEVVHVFVRDRGVGFDPRQVPDDRHGLIDSVYGRIERHGGSALVRAVPGEGTEVHLEMPRTNGEPRRVGQPAGSPIPAEQPTQPKEMS
jgi:signal transduction histidine kinase